MGDPGGLDDPAAPAHSYEDLREETHVVYADLDASPTKVWMVHHRAEQAVQPLFELRQAVLHLPPHRDFQRPACRDYFIELPLIENCHLLGRNIRRQLLGQ